MDRNFIHKAIIVAASLLAAGPLNAQPLATLARHRDKVTALAFSPDGKVLASGSMDASVILWDVATGKSTKTLADHDGYVYSIGFSPDGKLLAVGYGDPGFIELKVDLRNFDTTDHRRLPEGGIKVWDLSSGKEIANLDIDGEIVTSLRFSEDGARLIAGTSVGSLKSWTLGSKTAQYLSTVTCASPFSDFSQVAFALDGVSHAIGGSDGRLRIFDQVNKREWSVRHRPQLLSLAMSRDGRAIASGCDDVKLWQVAPAKAAPQPNGAPVPLKEASLRGYKAGVFTLLFSPDGKILVTGSGLYRFGGFYAGQIKLWDLTCRRELATLIAHANSVHCLAFTPDANILASGSYDNTICLWDVSKFK